MSLCVLLYHQVTGTCWCNGHAQTCLPDGKCNCTRNTVSATCQACAAGFYRSNISGGFTCRRKPQCCGVYFLRDALLLTVVEEPFFYSLRHFPTLCVLLDTFCLRITIWMYGILLHIAAILCFTSCCFSPCISTNSFLCMCVSVCVFVCVCVCVCYCRVFSTACQCNTSAGAKESGCSSIGMCQCRQGYTGQHCDVCTDGYHRQAGLCMPCNCGSATLSPSCDVSGQCACSGGAAGLKCDACLPGYYGLHSNGCR